MKFKCTKFILTTTITLSLFLTGCGASKDYSSTETSTAASSAESNSVASASTPVEFASTQAKTVYPIKIKHAFGETVIENKPERIATVAWGNHDLPLALGVVPVGISKANYGVTDGSGLLPWTAAKFKELGVEKPTLFDDIDGLNYEAISDSQPDVILAAYSGITKEEYDLLSKIAPVVAYPTLPWQTFWRDQVVINATAIGMKGEGETLVSDLENLIKTKTGEYPQLTGKTAAFFYFNPSDLSKFYIYLPSDPRAAYLTDLGMGLPESVKKLEKDSNSFALELSAENADLLQDVDIIVTYGNDTLLSALQSDSLLGTIPAVKRGSVAVIQDGTPLAASGTPSALSIPATIDEYLKTLAGAADKLK